MEPVFPTVADAQEMHDEAQLQHGQNPEPLLDPGGLESALGRAANHYYYGQGSDQDRMANAAGALAHGIGMAQAFGDGNKRAAYYTTHYFLHNNGYGQIAPEEDPELADHLVGHGEGTHTLEDTQNMLRQRMGGGTFSHVANILDPIQSELAPSVWDNPASPAPTLKPTHAHWIHKFIYHVLEADGYAKPHEWLHLVLTGSLTTYQYGDNSDVDVSLFVDAKILPEWSRAEMIGLMIEHCDNVKLPGTPYPLQCFVVAKSMAPTDLYRPGMRSGYDIDGNQWIVPPEHREHDVQAQENGMYVWALEMADKLERLQRYEPDKAKQFEQQIHQRRSRDMAAGKGDFSESNIVYKFLHNRGLLPETFFTKPARTADWVDEHAVPYIEQEGGGTFHPQTGESPTQGYQVSIQGHTVKHPEAIINDHPTLGLALHQFIQQHAEPFRDPNNYVGAWTQDGQLWLEPSENVVELPGAIHAGRQRNQIGIWDNLNRQEINPWEPQYDQYSPIRQTDFQAPPGSLQASAWLLGDERRGANGLGTRAGHQDPGAFRAARRSTFRVSGRYFIDHPQLGPGQASATEQMGPVGPIWSFIPDNGGRAEYLHPHTEPEDIERWATVRKARLPSNAW